jgi:hypothetical protein
MNTGVGDASVGVGDAAAASKSAIQNSEKNNKCMYR